MTTQQLLYRLVDRDNHEPWLAISGKLQGRADNWLVAHDLYHHQPTDRGTVAEELATLGAEYYICFEPLEGFEHPDDGALPPVGQNALTRAAAGIVGMCFEDERHGPGSFRLRKPAAQKAIPPLAQAIFAEVERSAALQLGEQLEGNDDGPWLAALTKFSTSGLIASWVAKGYGLARKRFPDQALVREHWHDALRRLNEVHQDVPHGAVLQATLSSYALDLQMVAPDGPHPKTCRRRGIRWERSCPMTGRFYEVEHVKALSWWLARGWSRPSFAQAQRTEGTTACN